MGEREPSRAAEVDGAARHDEVTHHGGQDEVLDGLFRGTPRQVAADVEEVVELERLDGQLPVGPRSSSRMRPFSIGVAAHAATLRRKPASSGP